MAHTFALISDARSGTEMLKSALRAHPRIATIDFSAVLPDQLLLQRRECCHPGCTHTGTITHVWAPRYIRVVFDRQAAAFWDWMRDAHDEVILLQRHNGLRQYLSCQVLMQTGRHKPYAGREGAPEPLRLDPIAFREHLESVKDCRTLVTDSCPRRLDIGYGDLINRWEDTLRAVQSHLGVELRGIQFSTVQQETRTLREAIRNYDEIAQCVRQLGHEEWLSEPET